MRWTRAAASSGSASHRGAQVCRPLHDRLETIIALGSDVTPAKPNLVTRSRMIGTLVNALDSGTGYTSHDDLRNAFEGCVGAVWTSDLGPVPAPPSLSRS